MCKVSVRHARPIEMYLPSEHARPVASGRSTGPVGTAELTEHLGLHAMLGIHVGASENDGMLVGAAPAGRGRPRDAWTVGFRLIRVVVCRAASGT
jgi:hypothetical protein